MGEFLSSLRHAHGYTQQQVADKLNVSNRTVSAWERDNAVPDVLLLPAIAELYGVTVDELLRGSLTERDSDKPMFSKQTELSMQRKKVSEYILRAYILLGVAVLGQILLFTGYLNSRINTDDVVYVVWTVFEYVGLALTVICTAVLFALWKSAESTLPPTEDNEELLYKLYSPIIVYLYIWSFISLLCSLTLSLLVGKLIAVTVGIISYVIFGVCASVCGMVLHTYAATKWNKSNRDTIAKLWTAVMVTTAFCLAVFSVLIVASDKIWQNLIVYAAVTYAFAYVFLLFVMLFERVYVCKYFKTDAQLLYCEITSVAVTLTALIFIAVSLNFLAVNAPITAVSLTVCISSPILIILGCVLPHIDLKRHASDSFKSIMKRNARLYRKIWLWGLIPLGVGCVFCGVGFYFSVPVFFAGVAILSASVVACTTICLAKRERPDRPQD